VRRQVHGGRTCVTRAADTGSGRRGRGVGGEMGCARARTGKSGDGMGKGACRVAGVACVGSLGGARDMCGSETCGRRRNGERG
jgi:hypothetical protein